MGDLPEGVHARVGSARAIQLEGALAGHLADRAVDFALHGAGILLNLPAAVPGPGILDEELETRHVRGYPPGARHELDKPSRLPS